MALINRKAKGSSLGISESDKEAEIKKLERERQRINLEIESLLSDYARKSGNRSLRPRKHRAGSAPNDYNYKK